MATSKDSSTNSKNKFIKNKESTMKCLTETSTLATKSKISEPTRSMRAVLLSEEPTINSLPVKHPETRLRLIWLRPSKISLTPPLLWPLLPREERSKSNNSCQEPTR